MGLSQLAEKCKKCPFVDKCEHKRMGELAYLPDSIMADTGQSATMSAAAPVLRETMKIRIAGKVVTVYKDDIEKELYKHLGVGLMQLGG